MSRKMPGDAQRRAAPTVARATVEPRRLLARLTEPAILFPALAVLALGLLWGTTLNLIRVERRAAEITAARSSDELAATYEAQVVRALREIDLTLKFVKYAYELRGRQAVLQELKAKSLLPPALLFVVSIADGAGRVVASTRPSAIANLADAGDLETARAGETLAIGRPARGAAPGGGLLRFSRRLDAPDGGFAGLVMIEVEAAFFVSGYDTSQLGERGVLAIVGDDGVFRARRTGETVSAGDTVGDARRVPAANPPIREAVLSINAWDGVPRYTSSRRLYEFPLAVIVGLAEDEQLSATRLSERVYLGRAAAGSVVVILVIAVLGRMSRQLANSRLRVVEEQIAHAERVEHLAYHDALTGLPNRSLFTRLLDQGIDQADRHQRPLAVMFLDLDRFKLINDTLGHEAGDRLLQEVAARLKACLQKTDTVARLGGDEFVVLLPEFAEESDVCAVARKILLAIARPFALLDQEFRVTASIGISLYPQGGRDEQTLTKNADIAMYRAKEEGKNDFRIYSDALNAHSIERRTLESGLGHAPERGVSRFSDRRRQRPDRTATRRLAVARRRGAPTRTRQPSAEPGTPR